MQGAYIYPGAGIAQICKHLLCTSLNRHITWNAAVVYGHNSTYSYDEFTKNCFDETLMRPIGSIHDARLLDTLKQQAQQNSMTICRVNRKKSLSSRVIEQRRCFAQYTRYVSGEIRLCLDGYLGSPIALGFQALQGTVLKLTLECTIEPCICSILLHITSHILCCTAQQTQPKQNFLGAPVIGPWDIDQRHILCACAHTLRKLGTARMRLHLTGCSLTCNYTALHKDTCKTSIKG